MKIAVTFDPKVPGAISGSLTLASDTSSDALSVPLSGTGAAAEVSVNPSTINFGSEVTGTRSASQVVNLKNPGLMALSVTSMAISPAQFAVSGPAMPQTVQPGASVQYTVSFDPAAAQGYSGTLSFTTDAISGSGAVGLTGTGIAGSTASVAVTPASLSFGSETVNNASGAQMVTLKNSGNASATIQAISSSNASFAYSGLSLPATIPASSSVQVAVNFDPKTSGALAGNLSITGTASGLPASVSMSGTGEAAQISVSPTSVGFGNETENTTSGSQSITVSNTGNAALSVTGVSISPAQFADSGPTPPYTVLPGSNVTYNVTFDPAAAQTYSGSLSVTSNAISGTSSVGLSGTGVAESNVLNVTPSSLSFGSELLNVASPVQIVTVKNGGNTSITINSATSSDSAFGVTGLTGTETLSSGQSFPLSVVYTPTVETGDNGTLTVSGTSSDGTAVSGSVSLSGTGAAQVSGAPLCGGQDDGLGHMPTDWATFTPPSTAGGTYTDTLASTLGGTNCTVKRLTVGGDTTHYYSTHEPMNINDTYIFVAGAGTCGSGGGWCVIDKSGNVVVNNAHIPGNGILMWSANTSTPNLFYYASGNKLMGATITGTNAVSTSTIYTFSQYSYITIPDETRISYDGSTIGLIGEHAGSGTVALDAFSFNLNTLTQSFTFTTQTSGSNGTTASGAAVCVITGAPKLLGSTDIGGCFHKVIMTTENALELELHPNLDTGMPSGCVLAFNKGYSCKALIGSNGTLSTIMVGTTHSDTFLSLDGTKNMRVELWDSSPDGNAGNDPCFNHGGHSVMNEDTLAVSCLFTTVFTGGHLSSAGTGPSQPWLLVAYDDTSRPKSAEWWTTSSNYTAPTTTACSQFVTGGSALAANCWFPYESEMVLVRADSVGSTVGLGGTAGKIYRLAWSRTRDDSSSFWGQQRAALSRDGKYVIFSSNMAYPSGSCSNPSDLACDDVYLIGPLF